MNKKKVSECVKLVMALDGDELVEFVNSIPLHAVITMNAAFAVNSSERIFEIMLSKKGYDA